MITLSRVSLMVSALALTPGCASRTDAEEQGGASSGLGPVGARVEAIRARFSAPAHVALPDAIALGFAIHDGAASPILPDGAVQRWAPAHRAKVSLPTKGSGAVHVEGVESHVAVSFTMVGAAGTPLATSGGMALYGGALGGADVIHRVRVDGTEDYVVFEVKPAREELVYEVDVTRVPGLRLVGNTVEFLDEAGSPRLRISPPYVVGVGGKQAEARLSVLGCAYDASGVAPWGRSVTKPGASRCTVRVTWSGEALGYPLMVDPSWVATGSMAYARSFHTATTLLSGNVLVVGGIGTEAPSVAMNAELYNPAGAGTFAATGPATMMRLDHTATRLGSGKVLLAGGFNTTGVLSAAETYDPATGTFAATGPMTAIRVRHAATLLGLGASAGVLLAGGGPGGPVGGTTEVFDPITATFAATGNLSEVRDNVYAAVRLSSGKVLIAGGDAGSGYGSTTADLFDPATGTCTLSAGKMGSPRYCTRAIRLSSGLVLVAGGCAGSGSTFYSTAELYDPKLDKFTPTAAPMTVQRANARTTLLNTGKVLVAGGHLYSGGVDTYYSTVELFDPGAGTFGAFGVLTDRRAYQAQSLLLDGRVLESGGVDTYGGPRLSTAEVVALKLNGVGCSVDDDCASGSCNTGICGKSALGKTCGAGSDCLSGFCADGVCCDSACNGACNCCSAARCATTNGTCKVADKYDAGNPSCAAYLCNGTVGTCPASCTVDADCGARYYCSAAGTCLARKAQGAACVLATDCKVAGACRACATGLTCADGVCCNTACTGLCTACSKATGAAVDGTCGNVAAGGVNPPGHVGSCAKDAGFPASCKADGLCNGSGACRTFAPPTTVCGAASCSGSSVVGKLCDGAGTCGTGASTPCAPYTCAAGLCKTACATVADCAPSTTLFCDSSSKTCLPKVGNGAACAGDTECTSGFCVDSVCCDKACTAACTACTKAKGAVADGTCGNVAAGTSCGALTCTGGSLVGKLCNGSGTCGPGPSTPCAPYVCAAGACLSTCATVADCASPSTDYCDTATGTCLPKAAAAKPCTSPDQCASGFCVDGVCCDMACTGQCEACAESGKEGTCTPAKGAPRSPRVACKDAPCVGTCDGTNAAACSFAPAECGAECKGDTVTLSRCDATGTCVPAAPAPCNGYACGDKRCKTTCATSADCLPKYTCDLGTCKLATATTPPPKVVGTFQKCSNPSECASGYCVDGVCCNTKCNEDCHSCALPTSPGTCSVVPVDTDPKGSCGPARECKQTCDGAGHCMVASPDTQCLSRHCSTTERSKLIGPAYCPSLFGTCPPAGADAQDCAPYACSLDACLTTCTKTDDCAIGFACNTATRTCETAPAPQEDGGGCSTSRASTGVPGGVFAGFAGVWAVLLRRRRRRA